MLYVCRAHLYYLIKRVEASCAWKVNSRVMCLLCGRINYFHPPLHMGWGRLNRTDRGCVVDCSYLYPPCRLLNAVKADNPCSQGIGLYIVWAVLTHIDTPPRPETPCCGQLVEGGLVEAFS